MVLADPRHHREPPGQHVGRRRAGPRRRVEAQVRRPDHGRAPLQADVGRVGRARLHRGLRLEGVPEAADGLRHPAARGPRAGAATAAADPDADHQGRRPRPPADTRGGARGRGPRGLREAREGVAGPVPPRHREAGGDRHPARGHEVRVRRVERRARADRRGAHARLVALLAEGRVPRRHQPAQLRQADPARLAGDLGLGQEPAGARAARGPDRAHHAPLPRDL